MKDLIKKLLRENIDDVRKKYEHNKKEFINSIKTFHDISDDDIPKIIDYLGFEGFNYPDDAIEHLTDTVNTYKSFSDPVILYRIIAVKNKKMINTGDLGEHFTPYEWAIDGDMLLSIGSENWDDDWIPYVLKVSVPLSEIDVWQTLAQNLSFPNEHEVNLRNNGKGAKLIKTYKHT